MKWRKPTCTLLVAMLILAMAMMDVGGETPLPKLFVDPPMYTATSLGEVFTIDIKIANVSDLQVVSFKLGYNTTLLDATEVAEGPFMKSFGGTYFTRSINETEGYVKVEIMIYPGGPAEGNGTLATVTFTSTYYGSASCALDLYDTELGDSSTPVSNPIDHEVIDGYYRFVIFGLTLAMGKQSYHLGETVDIYANLTMSGSSIQGLMALEVDAPNNYPIVARTMETGPPPPPGDISILEVLPCDSWGNPWTSFRRGAGTVMELFYVKITVKNNNPTEAKDVVVAANSYDVNLVPLGVAATEITQLSPGATEWHIMSIPIEDWASLGNATVYASAFTDWPGRGPYGIYSRYGIPYCPEKSASFQITDGTLGGGTLEAQGSGNNSTTGNYNLTFKPVTNITIGINRVYASVSYQGYLITNSTVFGINTINVPDHYPTIQAAVNAASPTNKSILVYPETYNEHVTINKTVKLVGVHPSNTIINGSGTGTVVTVTANNVEISRFTIKNGGGFFPDSGIALTNSSGSTVSESVLIENYNGIYLDSPSQEIFIVDNTITSNSGYGINIHSSDDNSILYNTLSSNNYGIHLNHSTGAALKYNTLSSNNHGIYLNHSTGTTLQYNYMICNEYNFGVFGDSISDFTHDIDTSNRVDGKPIIYWVNKHFMQVPSNAGFVAVVNSTNIIVRGLNLTKNAQGLLFVFTNDSLVYSNRVIYNGVGIKLISSNDNAIFHNDFMSNTQQVYNYSSANMWDDSAGKGNYWSDYTGVDDGSGNRTAGDGVGDTLLPHQGVDWYPLMTPWIPVHDVAITSVTHVIPYNASQVYPGWKIKIQVTVKNEGDYTETFDIIAYYAGYFTGASAHITELNPQEEIVKDLTWDTTSVSRGTYEITVQTSNIDGDADPTDNIRVDGTVKVNMIGDVTDNGIVDIFDLSAVALATVAPYNPLFDMNCDGAIDIFDLVAVAVNVTF